MPEEMLTKLEITAFLKKLEVTMDYLSSLDDLSYNSEDERYFVRVVNVLENLKYYVEEKWEKKRK